MAIKIKNLQRYDTSLTSANWTPLIFQPKPDSPDHFIFGAIAIDNTNIHVEKLECLQFINCLFGEDADAVMAIIDDTIEHIRTQHDLLNMDISNIEIPFSGVSIGESMRASGSSLSEISKSWLATSSSFGACEMREPTLKLTTQMVASRSSEKDAAQPIEKRIRSILEKRAVETTEIFYPTRTEIDKNIAIDFSGQAVVANIAEITASRFKRDSSEAKIKLFDIEQDKQQKRDTRERSFLLRVPNLETGSVGKNSALKIQSMENTLFRAAKNADVLFEKSTDDEKIADFLQFREKSLK
jgi:hypothetical protein